MVSWYKGYYLLDKHSKWIVMSTIITLIINLISYLLYLVGVFHLIPGNGLMVKSSSNFFFILNILRCILAATEQFIPIVCCILLFKAYLSVIYGKGTRVNIIPESNSRKIGRVFKVYVLWFIGFAIIEIFMYMSIYSLGFSDILSVVAKPLEYLSGPTVIVLGMVIVDMECKNRKLLIGDNVIWNIISIFILMIPMTLIMVICNETGVGNFISYFIFTVISFLEGFYIIKRINHIIII